MRRRPILQDPIQRTILVFLLVLIFYAYLTYRLGGLTGNIVAIAVDFLILVLGFFLWLAFFSQFVLPVRNLTERYQAFRRLRSYFGGRGGRGPAIFIVNGQVQQRAGESKRRGPGVILLDTASAGVLRGARGFTRAIGPGIVFTQRNEYLAGTVDLHPQTRTIGPPPEENPFSPQGKEEPTEVFNARQENRWLTSGTTRDGVEVVPVINVRFRLDSKPGTGGTAFGYHPESIRRAIASQGINPGAPSSTSARFVKWDWLPVHLAADLWREYLRKFTLNQLFVLPGTSAYQSPVTQRMTAYQTIKTMVNKRLTQDTVEEFDDKGRPTTRFIPSREYGILQARGIQVISISVDDLRFPPEVEDELISHWRGNWVKKTQLQMKEIERQRSRESQRGEDKALKQFANAVCREFNRHQINQFLLSPQLRQFAQLSQNKLLLVREALDLLMEGTLTLCRFDPQINPQLEDETTQLLAIQDWNQLN